MCRLAGGGVIGIRRSTGGVPASFFFAPPSLAFHQRIARRALLIVSLLSAIECVLSSSVVTHSDPPPSTIQKQRGVPVDWADCMGGGGQTALHLAAIHGHVDAVQSLIDLGADLNKVNDISSATPLHLAGTSSCGDGGVVCKPLFRQSIPSLTPALPTQNHSHGKRHARTQTPGDLNPGGGRR